MTIYDGIAYILYYIRSVNNIVIFKDDVFFCFGRGFCVTRRWRDIAVTDTTARHAGAARDVQRIHAGDSPNEPILL